MSVRLVTCGDGEIADTVGSETGSFAACEIVAFGDSSIAAYGGS